jgi:hypothetical protein
MEMKQIHTGKLRDFGYQVWKTAPAPRAKRVAIEEDVAGTPAWCSADPEKRVAALEELFRAFEEE